MTTEEYIKTKLEKLNNKNCLYCKKPFTIDNVYSIDGLNEIDISGLCELCFDELMIEYDE